MSILLAFLAMVLELLAGYPDRLYRAIGHPVSWMGRLIALADRQCNRAHWRFGTRRAAGTTVLVALIGIAGGIGWSIQNALGPAAGPILAAVAAGTLIAQRSLASHVQAVASALEQGGLDTGRAAVSRIVGRDPASLDEAGVARAAIESLAENFSDGIVAPVFWLALAGLPGAAIYKTINTADSMIGHRTQRHEAFGWAAARVDDLVNLPASRLSALLIAGAAFLSGGGDGRAALRAVARDARRHRSPNAGWPEAAMAGALGLALAGLRRYGGVPVDDAFMGEGGRREATAADIRRALRLYWWADGLLMAMLGLAAAVSIAAG